MKRFYLLFLLLLCQGLSRFVYSIDFRIVDGIDKQELKQKMENNARSLLESINYGADNGSLYISRKIATREAINEIRRTWQRIHFKTVDVIDSVYCSKKKVQNQLRYEARHIIVEVIPLDNTYDGNRRREIRLDFNTEGLITSLAITMPWESIKTIQRYSTGPVDYEMRQQIIDFCENLKDYYRNQDIDNLEKIYSKFAIVINGKKIGKRTEFTKLTGEEYLKRLKDLFLRCKAVEVEFDKYEVKRDNYNHNYYIVTFEQDWHTIFSNNKEYSDFGHVCLLWDFSEKPPVIAFRSWQPKDDPKKITKYNIHEHFIIPNQ